MPVMETMTFRLSAVADEAAFRAADERVQTEVAYRQPGIMRRTTARCEGGGWIVVSLWHTADEADAAAVRIEADPAGVALSAIIDRGSLVTTRYTTLD